MVLTARRGVWRGVTDQEHAEQMADSADNALGTDTAGIDDSNMQAIEGQVLLVG